ncbi:MAG: replication initiator protein [Arizlama microvirus]|nr:MAG: replication initiator protein [Arizlama microvirus]
MSCYSPLNGFLPVNGGKLQSSDTGDCRAVTVPCGGCIGCRLDRANGWAVRMLHESKLHDISCFVTFTYKDAPWGTSLNYRHFQLFMKKLRKSHGRPVRFFCAGEYGGVTWRPHFHAALFGFWPDDCRYYRKSPSGDSLYRSDSLDALWHHGQCAIGILNFSSAAYIARYCMKKVHGDSSEFHYKKIDPATGEVFDLTPEFAHMSLKPGLGAGFLDSYHTDVFPRDYVVMDGHKVPVPKYYRKKLRKKDLLMAAGLETIRGLHAITPEATFERTDARLKVRNDVAFSKMSFYKRDLE